MGGGKKTERKKMERERTRDPGIVSGVTKTGLKNRTTDAPSVLVSHKTVRSGDSRTGVAVTVPGPGNVSDRKFIAAGYVHSGFGKICGLVQVEELGALETPIALTSTLNVGLVVDTLVEYTIRRYAKEQVEVTSVSSVVGECNDCRINRIQHRAMSMEDVVEVFSRVDEDFEEGGVGADTGTMCYGLKGGIGSASRIMRIGGKKYTLGTPVQSNFGATEDPVIDGIRVGERILEEKERCRRMAAAEQNQGPIMIIVATDPPVSDRQLKRIIRRVGVGIAKTGACTSHGDGEATTGFTTAGRLRGKDNLEVMMGTCTRENLISVAFGTVAKAVHKAILNPTTAIGHTGGPAGEVYYSLLEFLPQILKY